MHLTLHDERVDLVAAVVDGDVSDQLDAAGLLVDLDDRDVHPEREREVGWVPRDVAVEVGLHAVGEVVCRERFERDGLDRHRLCRCATHPEFAFDEFEVGLGRLELVRDDGPRLLHDLLARQVDRRTPDRERP